MSHHRSEWTAQAPGKLDCTGFTLGIASPLPPHQDQADSEHQRRRQHNCRTGLSSVKALVLVLVACVRLSASYEPTGPAALTSKANARHSTSAQPAAATAVVSACGCCVCVSPSGGCELVPRQHNVYLLVASISHVAGHLSAELVGCDVEHIPQSRVPATWRLQGGTGAEVEHMSQHPGG